MHVNFRLRMYVICIKYVFFSRRNLEIKRKIEEGLWFYDTLRIEQI